ncbi:helix-turn-helix domain-containing protein [Streptosporangiaceae bacterium NEAU-GS5]|nr:helix-turn-helix domain-containing protein [Streptosporangiaceae bacterium NEAU-GS5]
MGRRMRPLNPAWGPVERFACELRALRAAAGEMPLRRMARRSAVSKSALTDAVAGFELPSEEVLRAFVDVCGGDWPWWRERRLGARAEAAADADLAEIVEAEGEGQGWLAPRYPGHSEPIDRRSVHVPEVIVEPVAMLVRLRRRRLRALAVFGTAAVVAFAAGWFVRPLFGHSPAGGTPVTAASVEAAAEASPTAGPADGVDPYISRCGEDQQLIETKGMVWPDHTSYGSLELFHSARCDANWGYVNGPNSRSWKVHIIVHRPADGITVPVVQSVDLGPGSWSGMLLTASGCVYIEAYVEKGSGRGPSARTSCYRQADTVLHS